MAIAVINPIIITTFLYLQQVTGSAWIKLEPFLTRQEVYSEIIKMDVVHNPSFK